MAPGTVATVAAWVPDAGFQAAMVPPTVAKMKFAGALVLGTTKPDEALLNVWPVTGAPGTLTICGEPAGAATTGLPLTAPEYSVEVPLPALDTQIGESGPRDIPQALIRFGSVICAFPGWSETRLVWVTPCKCVGLCGWCVGAALAGLAASNAAEPVAAAMSAATDRRLPIMVVPPSVVPAAPAGNTSRGQTAEGGRGQTVERGG